MVLTSALGFGVLCVALRVRFVLRHLQKPQMLLREATMTRRDQRRRTQRTTRTRRRRRRRRRPNAMTRQVCICNKNVQTESETCFGTWATPSQNNTQQSYQFANGQIGKIAECCFGWAFVAQVPNSVSLSACAFLLQMQPCLVIPAQAPKTPVKKKPSADDSDEELPSSQQDLAKARVRWPRL